CWFGDQPRFYWDYSPNTVLPCRERTPTDQMLVAVEPSVKWRIPADSLSMMNRFGSDNFWDVAGERLLTMGSEKGGIEEVWSHPFMAFRDYEVGIRFDYRDTIYWLNDERPEIEVNPAFFSRQYKFSRAYLKEVIVNDPLEPAGVIHYEYGGVYPAELVIRFRTNLRRMWPYSEKTTGSVCCLWDPDQDAFTAKDASGDLNVMIGGTRKPVFHLEGQFEGFQYQKEGKAFKGNTTDKFQAAGLIGYKLAMNDQLDVVYAATNEGDGICRAKFNEAIHHPEKIFKSALSHSTEILTKNLLITTPDVNFNKGYRWSLLATDRFFVNTPGMGKALVAGYSTTSHGWDGEHKVNGRPGYGWYFGRDGEWSSFALLDCGDFAKVKSELEFFNKYQDISGKIFHEASTSGIVHYDASDATPLYIVLAGKYFRHTNDTAFLRKIWPNVKRAISFCFSTDTDRDHLIENTNVGHGWVEGGELYGSHATLYTTGAWAAALTEAANMGSSMHDDGAVKYTWESEEVTRIINNDFWSDQQKFFAYGMNRNRTFRREQTVLAAVPIYFGVTDQAKAQACVKQYEGNAFSTNWGVRIIRDDSRWFKPTGYHLGSVWPLFTGWAALAEYATGNYLQGYSHLVNNLNLYKNWGLGFAEEVLNGSEYKPSGVCAHQCWSETMIIQPAIEGMLGLDIRAQENKMTLSPRLPAQWDSLTVSNIRMDTRSVDFHYLRNHDLAASRPDRSSFSFSLDHGKAMKIEFMPVFPPATRINKVSLDGHPLPFTAFNSSQGVVLYASFDLNSASRLDVESENGISVLPAVSDPKPGDPAEGLRILSTRVSGNRYQVEVEGKSGTTGNIEIYSPGQVVENAENARSIGHSGNIFSFAVDFEQSKDKYQVKIVTVTLNQH
ncbi:MAG: GH116 family glycosyl hydrolase, partial [Bacteroidota bacterium]